MHDCEPYQGEMVPVVVQIPPATETKETNLNAKGRNEAGFAYIYHKNSTIHRYIHVQ